MQDSESISVDRVRNIMGNFSIDSVRNWLKRCGLPSTVNSRVELIAKVHGLILQGKLTEDGLNAAIVGIEEASAKRTFLYRIPIAPSSLARIDKQLADLNVPITESAVRAMHPTEKPKLVYVINNEGELRAKWIELHTRVIALRKTRGWKETPVPKTVLLTVNKETGLVQTVNKETGLVQLRCDKPEDEHIHAGPSGPTAESFYSAYLGVAENLIGLKFDPVDLQPGLEKVLKQEPRIVRTAYVVDDSEDGGHAKLSHKWKNKDVRDTENWQQKSKSEIVRTFEESPLHWLKDMSGQQLHRDVFSYVDASAGQIRFDADCYEEEISYVLAQLV